MATVVGSASAAATSVAIPAHQVGDIILIAARGTGGVPTAPAAGGTVPTWTTLQSGVGNSVGLTTAFAKATATDHTSGTWANTTHIAVVVLRPGAGNSLALDPAWSSNQNGANTQTVVYPALTLQDLDGSSFGVRVGTRGVADDEMANAPSGWTNLLVQPAGTGALLAIHTRAGLTANPGGNTVNVTGTSAAYRANTIEVTEGVPVQNVAVGGISSPAAFGSVTASAGSPSTPQTVVVGGVYPPGYVPSITGQVVCGDGHLSGGSVAAQFGQVTATLRLVAQPAGVPSAQAFGAISITTIAVVPIAGVGSAQAFGTSRFLFRLPILGLGSAQAFGQIKANVRLAIGVSVPSAQSFGPIVTRTGFSQAVPGVPSAQAFGLVRLAYGVLVPGVGSAQAFGAIQLALQVRLAGVPSAQAFGLVSPKLVWISEIGCVEITLDPNECLTNDEQATASICGQVICGDGHLCGQIATGRIFIRLAPEPIDQPLVAAGAVALDLDPADEATLDLEPALCK